MLISLIAAAVVATAASATIAPTEAAPAAQTKNGDFNKVVCRTEEETGTRLGTVHVCMTKAQWEDRSAGQRAVFRDLSSTQIPTDGIPTHIQPAFSRPR